MCEGMNVVSELSKSIYFLLPHLMKSEQRTWPPHPGPIRSDCRGLCACHSKGVLHPGGVVGRSSVCFVDNWDLELKHRAADGVLARAPVAESK